MKMTEIEKLEAQIRCRKLVEGTDLNWWEVIKVSGKRLNFPPIFDGIDKTCYEFAQGIIEGKPVWEGDLLYFTTETTPTKINKNSTIRAWPKLWSWNLPKPETIMVEFLLEDALSFAEYNFGADLHIKMQKAIKKALDK